MEYITDCGLPHIPIEETKAPKLVWHPVPHVVRKFTLNDRSDSGESVGEFYRSVHAAAA
jgi:hypothetical protein